ncbi:hypothetical protein I7I53_07604 [Histoplasma capsulatum var. duboisii H88]|uniref:Uncharacterized protein n=1 Tax=Ajellomyces capsulatus (strain H88) TaxID=544711 RepID=A0A8A1LDV2_AJEC8|nr:hypothetical protein I7I53_07604 [Histoplasma capsulatum var. duboisii H88]
MLQYSSRARTPKLLSGARCYTLDMKSMVQWPNGQITAYGCAGEFLNYNFIIPTIGIYVGKSLLK